MQPNRRIMGFTVLEVIVVLGISGALLVVGFTAFNGRRQNVQFTQSVRDLENKIYDISNDVSNGYFDSGIVCTVSSGILSLSAGGATNAHGTNQNCIFVGKAIKINPTSIDIFTVVGKRETPPPTPRDVTSLDEATPTIPVDTSLSIKSTYNTSYSTKIMNTSYFDPSRYSGFPNTDTPKCNSTPTAKLLGFVIVTSFNGTLPTTGNKQDASLSGSINSDIIPICGNQGDSEVTFQTKVAASLKEVYRIANPKIGICMLNEYNNTKTSIIIEGRNNIYQNHGDVAC